jgi:glycolate dehydrogenase FAD-binding subunit
LPLERNEDTLTRVARATNDIFAQCAALAGNATIPWCPTEWKTALPVWGPERGDLGPMRALKKVFDPHGVFAPGRFMGGI